jgi:CHAT domain-containing protein
MARFHDVQRTTGLSASLALWNAQKWLRTASTKNLLSYVYAHMVMDRTDIQLSQSFDRLLSQLEDFQDDERPYADPYFWAGFTFTGADVVAQPDGQTTLPN